MNYRLVDYLIVLAKTIYIIAQRPISQYDFDDILFFASTTKHYEVISITINWFHYIDASVSDKDTSNVGKDYRRRKM